MVFENTFNMNTLFMSKTIKVTIDKRQRFNIKVPTIRELYENDTLNGSYHLWISPLDQLQKMYITPVQSS